MNATRGRLIAAVRRELPGRVLIRGQAHLRAVLTEYQVHCNTARPHQGIAQRVPGDEPDAARATATDIDTQQTRRKPVLGGLVGWPGAFQPRAPTDPGVTVSSYRALVILITRRWRRRRPFPVREHPRVSLDDSPPTPECFCLRPQPFVLVADPAYQVGIDALQERIHRRPVERAVVVHPTTDDRVDVPRHVDEVLASAVVQPPGPHLRTDLLQGWLTDRGIERVKLSSRPCSATCAAGT